MEETRNEEAHPPDRCPGCGRQFQCGMKAGMEPCWCASLPPLVPLAGVAECYCPQCLAQRVKEGAGSKAG